jgi:hypothetical protein
MKPAILRRFVGADDSEGVTQTPEPNEAAEPI